MANPGDKPLPVGLGFHPYLNVPFTKNGSAGDCLVTVGAASYWELQDNIPTGPKLPVDAKRDLRKPRRFDELQLDDVYTDLETPEDAIQLHRRASIAQSDAGAVEVWTSGTFREMVVYTPPHRHAICLEPYTCATDAINMQQQGVDAGLVVLEPGKSRTEFIVLRFTPK
jgi:aldose 1-epimerase